MMWDPWDVLDADPEFKAAIDRGLADMKAGRVFKWHDIRRWMAIRRGEVESPCPPHEMTWAGDIAYCRGCGFQPESANT